MPSSCKGISKKLEEEFFDAPYTNPHFGFNCARLKFDDHINQYPLATLKIQCHKWCKAFNYAQSIVGLRGMEANKTCHLQQKNRSMCNQPKN